MTSTLTLHAAPSSGFDEPFEMLLSCHERVERMITLLERLAVHLAGVGCDGQAKQAAQDVMRYFDQAGPAHHEDEERHLFPALLAQGDAAMRALVQGLQRDHHAMVRQWALLRADLHRVAEGTWQAPTSGLGHWADFAALYRGHIVAEEGRAYPAARALLDRGAQAAMGDEMARRRGGWSDRGHHGLAVTRAVRQYSVVMRRPWSLSTKLGAIGGTLLLMALVSIGLTLWVTWQLEGGAAAVNEAGRMRMQTWRLAQTLAGGDVQRVDTLLRQFDQSVAVLRSGDPSRPLFVPRDDVSQAAFADVQQGWQALRGSWSAQPLPAAPDAARQAEAFVDRIDHFVSAIETQLARLTTILNAFQFLMVALAIVSAVALLYSAYLFVFNPLARLQSGLARVEEGDLAARVEVASDDEFGALSAGFNRMAETLQGLYQNLEAKVQEKTLRLETQHARLAALYEAAAFVGRATTLDELAQGFARQLRQVAQADASAVRWSDESNQRYLLLASDGLPQELVDEEHCIPTGDCFCGQPQGQASTRVIPIRAGLTASPLGHCARAGFETVVSVPVRLQERMVGELNLFYRTPAVLADDDRALLETLASHLAGAIEGLRVGALERETAVAEERGLLARELHDSIAQSLAFLKIQAGLLRGALKRHDAAQVERTLGELDAGVHESLSDVRELLMHFRTRTNAEDIAPALQVTLQKFEHQTGLPTHLSIEGNGMPLDADVQVQVLHVVQEALSNVRKHAHAHAVWLEVQQAPQWRVEVRDDGCGFTEERAADDETHVGLRIMRERAQRIGATVEVSSVPGSGTCVVLTLPERQRIAA